MTGELLPLPVTDRLPGLPVPADLGRGLREKFREAVGRERAQRGEVTSAADVAHMVRAVEGFRDLCANYGRVLKETADDAKAVLGEELVEVYGESKGIAQGRLYVEDEDGTLITVKPNTEHRHDIDTGQVLTVVALWLAAEWSDNPDLPEPAEAPELFAIAVTNRVLLMIGAKAKLLITHANGLVEQLKAAGEDELAATAQSAIRSTEVPKGDGVQVTRTTAEQQKIARSRRKAS